MNCLCAYEYTGSFYPLDNWEINTKIALNWVQALTPPSKILLLKEQTEHWINIVMNLRIYIYVMCHMISL